MEKRGYKEGVVISTIFLIILVFSQQDINLSNFTRKTVVLSHDPEFKFESGGRARTAQHWLEMNFYNESSPFIICDFEYKFLKKANLTDNVKAGDTITIFYESNRIYYFENNGIGYIDLKQAEIYSKENTLIEGTLLLTILIFCIIPLCFRQKPVLHIFNKKYNMNFGLLLLVALVVVTILLYFIIGFESLTDKEFIN